MSYLLLDDLMLGLLVPVVLGLGLPGQLLLLLWLVVELPVVVVAGREADVVLQGVHVLELDPADGAELQVDLQCDHVFFLFLNSYGEPRSTLL